jgi:MORN repeat variant
MKRIGNWFYIALGIVLCAAAMLWFKEASNLYRLSEKIMIADGKHEKYYPDGAVQSVSTYKNDKLHGDGIEYYPDGKTKYEDFWVNGNLVWRQTYDTNGILVQIFGERPAASTNWTPPVSHTNGE